MGSSPDADGAAAGAGSGPVRRSREVRILDLLLQSEVTMRSRLAILALSDRRADGLTPLPLWAESTYDHTQREGRL